MSVRPQAEHPWERQGHGASRFPLQIRRLRLTPLAENALSSLSSRLRVPALSGKAEKIEKRCSPLIFSPLLFSAGAFLRARTALPGRSAAGKPAAGLRVRLLTGEHSFLTVRQRFLEYRCARAAAPGRSIPGSRTGFGIALEIEEL